MRNKNRAFTLIELLVVIAIIGILASVVVASVNSAREKGRIGAGMHFAEQIEHVAGELLLGKWNYDECSGNPTYDTSGWGNNGTLNSAASFDTTGNTPSGKGCSMHFDGTNGMNYTGNSSAFQFGTGSITIAGWIYPTIVPTGANSILSSWGSPQRIGIGIGTGLLIGYMVKDSLSNEVSGGTTTAIPLNKWSFLTMVVDRTTNRLNIYLDGKLVPGTNYDLSGITGSLTPNANVQSAASWGGASNYLTGNIDEVRVYGKALTASEVGGLYAEGVGTHNFAEK